MEAPTSIYHIDYGKANVERLEASEILDHSIRPVQWAAHGPKNATRPMGLHTL